MKCIRIKQLLSLKPLLLSCLNFGVGFAGSFFFYSMRMDFEHYGVKVWEIPLMLFIIEIPNCINWLFAILCDIHGVNGYHRKPYISGGLFLMWMILLILSQPFEKIHGYIFSLFFYNLFYAIVGLNLDAYIIEDSKDDHTTNNWIVIFSSVARGFGFSLGSIIGPILWAASNSTIVYTTLTGCVCLTLFFSRFIVDRIKTVQDNGISTIPIRPVSIRSVFVLIIECFKDKMFFMIWLYTIIFLAWPSDGVAMFFYYIGPLEFEPTDITYLEMASGFGRLLGGIIFYRIEHFEVHNIIFWSSLISSACIGSKLFVTLNMDNLDNYYNASAPLNFTNDELQMNRTNTLSVYLGIPNIVFPLLDAFIGSTVRVIRFMPLTISVARVCKQSIEGSFSSFVSSSLMIGIYTERLLTTLTLSALGIDYTTFNNLFILNIICLIGELLAAVCATFIHSSKILIDREQENQTKESVKIFTEIEGNTMDEAVVI